MYQRLVSTHKNCGIQKNIQSFKNYRFNMIKDLQDQEKLLERKRAMEEELKLQKQREEQEAQNELLA